METNGGIWLAFGVSGRYCMQWVYGLRSRLFLAMAVKPDSTVAYPHTMRRSTIRPSRDEPTQRQVMLRALSRFQRQLSLVNHDLTMIGDGDKKPDTKCRSRRSVMDPGSICILRFLFSDQASPHHLHLLCHFFGDFIINVGVPAYDRRVRCV